MRKTLAVRHSLLAFTCLLACLSAGAVCASRPGGKPLEVGISRLAVSFEERQKHQVKAQLRSKGYRILSEGPGFFAVTHSSLAVPSAAAAHGPGRKLIERAQEKQRDNHLASLRGIPGVRTSEQDVRRYLHVRPLPGSGAATVAAVGRKLSTVTDAAAGASPAEHLTGHWHTQGSFKPGPYDVWGNSVGDQVCAGQDTQLTDTAGSETIPWGIKRIGALNDTVRNAQPKGRVIVCIIDSGLSGEHPEYKKTIETSDRITGCKGTSNCPFEWSGDIVGHGTHVAGTIAAPQNGLGVVGVISNGAELHIVRVWNDSGDVSQGQGPYATDLVLAYDNCLGYLQEQQKKDKNIKMVINMSYGSAGPLTVERLWIQNAAKRGDMLFVGSAGNNGSWLPTQPYGADFDGSSSQEDPGQYLSYPASYALEEMMSVANARCDGTIDFSSQKNKQVSIAAPGMAILSSVPKYYGAMRSYITTSTPLPNQTEPVPATDKRSNGWFGGRLGRTTSGSSSAIRTRTGLGILPSGYREPRPVQGTAVGSSGMLPLVQCSVDAAVKAAAYNQVPEKVQKQQQQLGAGCPGASGAVCMIELPGSIDWYHETCIAMLSCVQGGGKGLILWRDDKMLEGMYSSGQDYTGYYGYQPDEVLLGVQVNCGTRCACWAELKKQLGCADGSDCNGKAPPGIVVSAKHAEALKGTAAAAVGKSTAGAGVLRVNITNYEYNYRHYDGTSMAAPHVSGAAALLWRLVPNCRAADVSQALKAAAEKLPDQKGVDIAAGSGMVRVDLAYDWILKNKACAGMEKSARPPQALNAKAAASSG